MLEFKALQILLQQAIPSVHYKFTSLLARAASSTEKININFVCEIVNFGSLNLIILKKKSKNTTNITIFSQYLHFYNPNRFFFLILFERNATFITFLEQIVNDKLLLVLNY